MEPKNIFIVIIIFVIILIGYIVVDSNNADDQALLNDPSQLLVENDGETNTQIDPPSMEIEAGESADKMEDDMNSVHGNNDGMMNDTGPGKYLTYNADSVSNSNAEHIVLSFSATWCPSCRTLDKDINASLSDIPDGIEIYKVDYDTNLELRKKYGITTQHTQVVIDKDGNLIKKWVGSNTLEQFVAQI